MFTQEMLRLFPRKRIKALDGMAVTADVWEEAHDYHRQLLRYHTLLQHGSGIITGLEVIASEPADSSVYILPGIAIDHIGQTVVLPEPRSFDLGSAEALMYLIITYNESRPQALNGRMQEDAPLYVHAQFSLEAVTELPPTPHIELARVQRRGFNQPVTVAKDPARPRANEIDLRYRQEIGYRPQQQVAVAVVELPGAENSGHANGLLNVAAGINRAGAMRINVDRGVSLDYNLSRYALLCLVGRDTVDIGTNEMGAIYEFMRNGGTLFYESCRRSAGEAEPGADRAFQELMSSMGLNVQPVGRDHPLLASPNLFAAPPDGYETRGTPSLRAGEGVLVSTFDFGCIWQGERRGRPASRSEIRNALEFGENLIAYAAKRRAQAS